MTFDCFFQDSHFAHSTPSTSSEVKTSTSGESGSRHEHNYNQESPDHRAMSDLGPTYNGKFYLCIIFYLAKYWLDIYILFIVISSLKLSISICYDFWLGY